MMEMSEGGGVGNAAFDATGDDLDSRQQQATEKVYSFITFSAQQRKRVVLFYCQVLQKEAGGCTGAMLQSSKKQELLGSSKKKLEL